MCIGPLAWPCRCEKFSEIGVMFSWIPHVLRRGLHEVYPVEEEMAAGYVSVYCRG